MVGAKDACASKILREGCPAVPTKLDGLCGKITKSAYLVSFLGVVSLTRLEYR